MEPIQLFENNQGRLSIYPQSGVFQVNNEINRKIYFQFTIGQHPAACSSICQPPTYAWKQDEINMSRVQVFDNELLVQAYAQHTVWADELIGQKVIPLNNLNIGGFSKYEIDLIPNNQEKTTREGHVVLIINYQPEHVSNYGQGILSNVTMKLLRADIKINTMSISDFKMSPYIVAHFGNNKWKSMTKLGEHQRPNWQKDVAEYFQYQKPAIDTTLNVQQNSDRAYTDDLTQIIEIFLFNQPNEFLGSAVLPTAYFNQNIDGLVQLRLKNKNFEEVATVDFILVVQHYFQNFVPAPNTNSVPNNLPPQPFQPSNNNYNPAPPNNSGAPPMNYNYPSNTSYISNQGQPPNQPFVVPVPPPPMSNTPNYYNPEPNQSQLYNPQPTNGNNAPPPEYYNSGAPKQTGYSNINLD